MISAPFLLRYGLPALVAAALTTQPSPGAADPPAAPAPSPQEQTLQGLDLMLQGVRRMIEQVPLYGPPEVAPNGDIVLHRLSPDRPPPSPPGTPADPHPTSPPGLRM